VLKLLLNGGYYFRINDLSHFITVDLLELGSQNQGIPEVLSNVFHRSHGTTWSVYFKDPEGNGLEVFCDTPWHVDQPQGDDWDPTLTDDELLGWTESRFRDEPGFARR
jgi:catechol 2,3-dioxygenase